MAQVGLLLLEIDPRQAERVRAMAAAALPDADAAVKHAEKLIASKTAKGYQETLA